MVIEKFWNMGLIYGEREDLLNIFVVSFNLPKRYLLELKFLA